MTETPLRIQQPPWDYSPFFFDTYLYDLDLDCIWILIAPNHYQIALEFNQLDIEGQYPCPFDYVQVKAAHGNILFQVEALKEHWLRFDTNRAVLLCFIISAKVINTTVQKIVIKTAQEFL